MDDFEVTQKKMVEFLRSTRTLDDIKERKSEFLGLIEEQATNMLKLFRDLVGNAESMDPGKIEKELGKFKDESTFFTEDLAHEFDRLDNLPGGITYMSSLMEELEDRLFSLREEFLEMLPELVDKLNSMEGGMTPGLSRIIGEMRADAGATSAPPPPGMPPGMPPPYISTPKKLERVKLKELEMLYKAETIDDLVKDKEELFNTLEGMAVKTIDDLHSISNTVKSAEDAWNKIESIEHQMDLLDNEMNIEMERLIQIPGAAGKIELFQKEMRERLAPKGVALEELLDGLKRKYS